MAPTSVLITTRRQRDADTARNGARDKLTITVSSTPGCCLDAEEASRWRRLLKACARALYQVVGVGPLPYNGMHLQRVM
jgi:hypothetical protein